MCCHSPLGLCTPRGPTRTIGRLPCRHGPVPPNLDTPFARGASGRYKCCQAGICAANQDMPTFDSPDGLMAIVAEEPAGFPLVHATEVPASFLKVIRNISVCLMLWLAAKPVVAAASAKIQTISPAQG